MPSDWRQTARPSGTDVRIDPYFLWAEATQFVYLFGRMQPKPSFSVSIRVRDGFTAKRLANGDWEPHGSPPSGWQEWLKIPRAYADPPLGLDGAKSCSAIVTPRFFAELRAKDSALSKLVWQVNLGLPLPTRPGRKPALPVPAPVAHERSSGLIAFLCKILRCLGICKSPPAPAPQKTVFTGIIDDGLAFAHEHFRLADGKTRVEFLWNQDGLLSPPSDVFNYGLELTKADTALSPGIDSHLDFCQRSGIVDEDWVYQRSGHLSFAELGHKPVALRASHGTHVMDIACGHDAAKAPGDRPIIGVQLPVAATADTSGGTLIPNVLDAIYYILTRAGATPVVINLSYGITAGPHDGTSQFETDVDQFVRDRAAAGAPLTVVLPAGNSRLLRGHAKFALGKQGKASTQELRWRVLPDDATPSYLEIWLPPSTGQDPKVKVKVRTPWGNESPAMQEGDLPWTWAPNAQVLCQVSYVNAGLTSHRGMILVAIAATATNEPNRAVAPCGEWKVFVENIGEFEVDDVRAWIRRDDTPYGYPMRGRQSRFVDTGYVRHDEAGREVEIDNLSYVQRDGTISSLATGKETIVVGGFKRTTWAPVKYSSSGPVVSPPGRTGASPDGPDGVAVSDDSHMHHGILAAGTHSSSIVEMYGTSVAAPQVTRWAVEHMARMGQCTRVDFDSFVRLGVPPFYWAGTMTEAVAPPGVPPPPWQPGGISALRVGGGRVEFPAGTFPSVVDRGIER